MRYNDPMNTKTQTLQRDARDLHREVFGTYPHHWTVEQWEDVAFLEQKIDSYFEILKEEGLI